MVEVEIRTLKDVDLKGGTVVAAFPSVGLVSTISATYMITTLKVDQVTALESADFPSVSVIYAKKPKFPARVYASANPKLAIFICEMPLPVWGVGSTDRARAELEKRGINQLETGMITGVTGVLLNEGRWRNVDVVALLAEARREFPDARAAVSLVQAVDLLLPEISIDLKPLQAEAKALEDRLTRLKQQAGPVVPEPIPSDMYR